MNLAFMTHGHHSVSFNAILGHQHMGGRSQKNFG